MIGRVITAGIKFICSLKQKRECQVFSRVLELERQIAIIENELVILKEKYKKNIELKRIENMNVAKDMNVAKEKKEDFDIASIVADLQAGADLQTILAKNPKIIEYILKKIL